MGHRAKQDGGRRAAGRDQGVGRGRSMKKGRAGGRAVGRRGVEDWIIVDERMTGAQASALQTLLEGTGEELDESMTKAQASERIEELERGTGWGLRG